MYGTFNRNFQKFRDSTLNRNSTFLLRTNEYSIAAKFEHKKCFKKLSISFIKNRFPKYF